MTKCDHDWQPGEAPHYRCAICGAVGRRVLPRYRGDRGTKARPVGQIVPTPEAKAQDARYAQRAARFVNARESAASEYVPQTTARIDEIATGRRRS